MPLSAASKEPWRRTNQLYSNDLFPIFNNLFAYWLPFSSVFSPPTNICAQVNCSWMEFVTNPKLTVLYYFFPSYQLNRAEHETRLDETAPADITDRKAFWQGPRTRNVLTEVFFRHRARENTSRATSYRKGSKSTDVKSIRKRHRRESICKFYPITFFRCIAAKTFQYKNSMRNAREKKVFQSSG